MPALEDVTTKTAKQVWSSPDGQRKIHAVTLEWQGKTLQAKTYSDAIGTIDWQGNVETYEKESRNGPETFVKQPPKENPGYGSTSGGSSRSGSGYTPKDEKAIQAMWAIDKAKDVVLALPLDPKGPMDDVEAAIEEWAQRLFAMVSRVKATPSDTEFALKVGDTLNSSPPLKVTKIEDLDEVAVVSDEELAKINDIFGPPAGDGVEKGA